jgi:hypothetical protein
MSTVDVGVARRHLEALFASPPARSLIEVRFRSGERMHQSFHRADALADVVAEIERRARSTDVFVGVVARARRGGGRRDLVRQASVLWVDCDAPAAVVALRAFRPAPSILVATGRPSGSGRHAYWLLREPVALEDLARGNRRLAWALGADLACSEPARILRPAGSMWHKASPPVAVRLLRLNDVDRRELDEVVGELADVPPSRAPTTRPKRQLGASGDPLLAIATTDYVERLIGRVPGRGGKVRCPFHELSVGRAIAAGVLPACSLADASLTDRGGPR